MEGESIKGGSRSRRGSEEEGTPEQSNEESEVAEVEGGSEEVKHEI